MSVIKDLGDIGGLDLATEVFEVLHEDAGTVIERIVSNGQPTGWFDQDHDEWVMVLSGGARLGFAEGDEVELRVGESLLIPARVRHQVVWTAQPTVWVAVHFPAKP